MWRAIDAGEPSGSAGPPILLAIDAQELVDVGVIVSRYFGGTKLGVGGLVRAYGDAAAAALDEAPRRQGVRAVRLEISYPFALTAAVMRSIERADAVDVEHGYDASGQGARIELTIPASHRLALVTVLREQTAGELEPCLVADTTIYRPV